jgi:cobalt-zinc-cadmium efflux system outer membrane protein
LQPFLIISLCAAALTAGIAHAQITPMSSTAPLLTVTEVVRQAIENNPRVLAASYDVQSATSGVRSARARVNPNAFIAPGITSISGTGEEFLIQQPLEINGTRNARIGVAQAQLRTTHAQAVLSLRDVVFTAKSTYYELARAQEQVTVAREALEVAQEFDRIARRQVEEGARPGIDLSQTSLEVSRAQRQVTLANGQVTTALAALNTVLGRSPESALGSLTPLAALAGSSSPRSTQEPLLDQALQSRTEIQAEKAAGEQFRQEARLARAEGRPDLVPQFRVGYFTRGLQPTSSGNGAGIGLAITLPLLDYGSRKNRIQQAEQAARAQDSRVVAAQNEVRQQVIQALARQHAAEEVVRTYQSGALGQARRLLEGSRVGFREGRTSVVALLEAQRSFRAIQNEYVNALADAAIARAEVEQATGAIPATLLPTARP